MTRLRLLAAPLAAAALFAVPAGAGVDLDRPPIDYAKAPADNAVSRLQHRLATGKAKLTRTDDHGYLKALLAELKVPESSQVLVFTRTSLQRSRIGPKTPRAVYFNDDVYVGFCQRGDVLELSAADPALGTVFYTLDQEPADRPRFVRHTESCLICHGSSFTQGLPGHLVRSVHPDRDGEPILGSGSHRTDHTSPFENRWGGWYVTGTHGDMEHMGNRVFRNRRDFDDPPNPGTGQNVTDLRPYFTTGAYLTPHSDLVALMVLEHQAMAHNRLTRAALDTRMALHYQDELNRALKEKPGHTFDSTARRVQSAGDDLLKVLLFCDEAKLTAKVAGTTAFAKEFAARGPFDPKGRSLREFDLSSRLFKYPCSYLIYSESFEKLPPAVKGHVLRRLHDVLSGKDTDKAFAHLTAADRKAVFEIVRDTKPNLPAYWRE